MRVRLTVVHTERGGEPRTYVLEQDPIVIGRAGTCDLPLDDPDRVVSKAHAELRREGDGLRVVDLGSKNQTFVNGQRVGPAGLPVADGDRLQMGPFQVDVVVDRARLVADDLDRTVFGAAFVNPFGEAAEGLAAALGQIRRAYAELDYGHRADALADALRAAFGPGPDAEALGAVVRGETPSGPMAAPPMVLPPMAVPQAPGPAPFAADPFAAPGASVPDPYPPTPYPPAPYPPSPGPPAPAAGPAPPSADLLQALAAAVARLVSIPGQFRHEFLGHTVVHAPETAFLFDADVAALVAHLSHPDPAERARRGHLLGEAAEAVLHHHQGLLEGYRAAVRDGAAALLDAVDPDRLGDVGGGVMPGARERALLDVVRQRCADLRGESFAAAERRVYRPAFVEAYLDRVARPSPTRPTDP